MAIKRGKSKQETFIEEVSEAVGAGRKVQVETVDFSDPERPPTCLEVDFPMLPINEIAAIEGNAGKPIYQTSKWWARRRSSVFRAMLLAAAMKAPDDRAESAKAVWDVYYANHQQNDAFRKLKVADIFMGGGTTVVEGARLGMKMYGNDLNPVAWLVVKNQLASVDPDSVQKLLNDIETEVRPQLMPFYACDCPRGHKGKWTQVSTGKTMGQDFDPLALSPQERKDYRYHGPEVIYTFWAKHGPCMAKGCGHRTPIMTSPVVAVKSISVKAWQDHECAGCGKVFDIEKDEARMAPGVPLVVTNEEMPFSLMNEKGLYDCPHCGTVREDLAAAINGASVDLGKPKNKKIDLTLLVHPDWLKGATGRMPDGTDYGGSADDPVDATVAWNNLRASSLRLLEVRGQLPQEVTCPETGVTFRTDEKGGTAGKKSSFNCQAPTCGRGDQDVLTAVKQTGKTGPMALYAIQGYCPECNKEGKPYNGRFFTAPANARHYNAAASEWARRKSTDLQGFWPTSELSQGWKTHSWGIPDHGFTHYWKMFNDRQLLVHSILLKTISSRVSPEDIKLVEVVLGAFQQYLRNQNLFAFWNLEADKLEPHFCSNNYHPKSRPIENNVFSSYGRGNWQSCRESVLDSVSWAHEPWELASRSGLARSAPALSQSITGKSVRVPTADPVEGDRASCTCCSSHELNQMASESVDLVITDPPFSELIQYSELSDFFYVWLRLPLKAIYPDQYGPEYTPKSLEAVENPFRHPQDAKDFYKHLLTECWKEAHRILKSGGLLAFTFHHSEDQPWLAVLESLFSAGFYLEATYPIRSDETKGDGQFGSQKLEYDIIHVCRKRTTESELISWAKLRRQIMADVRRIRDLLEQHQSAGLPVADIQVIRRGKALEYFSRHYGKVYVEQGRDFSIREALVGINQILDEEDDTSSEAPPPSAEPYTRQFLRIFADATEVPRDQMQKYLRGSGIAPSDFESRDWCNESKKVFYMNSPLDLARKWKGIPRRGMARDFDQTMFMIGACFPNSGIRLDDTLNSPGFEPHPATGPLLDWMTRHGGSFEMRQAATLAKQLYGSWQDKNKSKVREQMALFDMADQEV